MKLDIFSKSVMYSLLVIVFFWTSILLSFTTYIWYLTRITGLIAYVLFFVTICIGIIRKFNVRWAFLIKYHKSTAIWAFIFASWHFITVIFDNYKWGFQLNLLAFLGLNFSDQWNTLVSLGVIAFFIFIIVIATSIGKNISRLGFKLWKRIHYLSYIGFILIQIHSMLLGTDFKYMSYSFIIWWTSILMFSTVVVLFLIRVFIGTKKKYFPKQIKPIVEKSEMKERNY